MYDALFTWQSLITLGGAAMLTFLIVLYTSRVVDSWWKWGTDLYAALWGFIVLTVANLGMGSNPEDWRLYALSFFNAFLVAAAAGKLRDKSITEMERRKDTSYPAQQTEERQRKVEV